MIRFLLFRLQILSSWMGAFRSPSHSPVSCTWSAVLQKERYTYDYIYITVMCFFNPKFQISNFANLIK